jgi:hypothetical protein
MKKNGLERLIDSSEVSQFMRIEQELGVVVHVYNSSTQEAEAGRSEEFEASLCYITRPCLKKGCVCVCVCWERTKVVFRLLFLFFLWYWGLISAFHLARQVLCHLSHITSLFLLQLFFR